MTMITVQPPVNAADNPPHPLFRIMLKERYRMYRQLLDQLAAYRRMPDRGGYEPAALAAMLRRASGGVADSANALQRISNGTYGPCERCGRDIPLGRLRMRPDARYCVSCELLLATGVGVDTTKDIELAGVGASEQRTASRQNLERVAGNGADVPVTTASPRRQQAAATGTCAVRPSASAPPPRLTKHRPGSDGQGSGTPNGEPVTPAGRAETASGPTAATPPGPGRRPPGRASQRPTSG
jgi:DnaK suppressor protein